VLFALETQDAQRLLAAGGDDELTEIIEDVEERWDDTWLTELDKSWGGLVCQSGLAPFPPLHNRRAHVRALCARSRRSQTSPP
jgi:hypothetical protein